MESLSSCPSDLGINFTIGRSSGFISMALGVGVGLGAELVFFLPQEDSKKVLKKIKERVIIFFIVD